MHRPTSPVALALVALALAAALTGCGAAAAPASAPTVDTRARVSPSAGQCPASHPIKAGGAPPNDTLQTTPRYHVPGGEGYDRAFTRYCYITEAAAAGDGYQRARR